MFGVPQAFCFKNDLRIFPLCPGVSSAKSYCGFTGFLSQEMEASVLKTNEMSYFQVRPKASYTAPSAKPQLKVWVFCHQS